MCSCRPGRNCQFMMTLSSHWISLMMLIGHVMPTVYGESIRVYKQVGDPCNADTDAGYYESENDQYYLFCAPNGKLARWRCPTGQKYWNTTVKCIAHKDAARATNQSPEMDLEEDPIKHVQRQPPGLCPFGQAPLIDPFSGQPQICATTFNTCQAPYTCQSLSAGVTSGYCCLSNSPITQATQATPVCGTGTPYLLNGAPIVCTPGTLSCPANHVCQLYSVTNIYYCCTGNIPSSVCGTGTPLFVNNAPMVCTVESQTCPATYTCQRHAATGNNYCCQASTLFTGCPTGTSPILTNGIPLPCVPTIINTCPGASSCQFNSLTQQYQCCTQDSCPVGQVSFIDITTSQPLACAPPPSTTTCPTGFGCTFSAQLQRYACCGQSFGCPFNSAGLVNTVTGQAQVCQIGTTSCPAGFICTVSLTLNQPICCTSSTAALTCPTGGSPLTIGTAPVQCSALLPCPTNYQCVQVATQFVCCPGSSVGTGPVVLTPECTLPLSYGERCLQSLSQARYYYSAQSLQCLQFIYLGCAGNANNFPTQDTCQQTCQATGLCPAGDPLPGAVCSTNLPCQSGYDCVSSTQGSFCCPSQLTVCQQSVSVGTQCGTVPIASTRFYFDVSTGVCRNFQYLGCGGNSNNFALQQRCEEFCLAGMCRYGTPLRVGTQNQVCSASANTCPGTHSCVAPMYGPAGINICCPRAQTLCATQLSVGQPCTSTGFGTFSSVRYYFEPTTKQCQLFQYQGCGGNDNNFKNQQECIAFCSSTVCTAGQPIRDPAGNLQVCQAFGATTCPSNYQCTPSGTSSYCCPTASYVCSLNIDAGQPCTGGAVQLQRWYFSPTAQSCQQFIYFGCGGNDNRFDSTLECQTFCNQANLGVCTNGLPPLMVSGTTIPQSCTINIPNSCPVIGYTCTISTRGQPVCCQGSTGQCPQGFLPYFRPGTQETQTCTAPGAIGQCVTGYTCVQAINAVNTFVCCQAPSQCPGGLTPELQPGTSSARVCTLNVAGTCSLGYTCMLGTNNLFLCCLGSATCPAGQTPLLITGTSQTQTCTLGAALTCPSPYFCTSANGVLSGTGVCCLSQQQQQQCPLGAPYIPAGAITPQQCVPNAPNNCPAGYLCQQSFTTLGGAVFICCSGQLTCPTGGAAYVAPGSSQPLACTLGSSTICPSNYMCMQSNVAGQFVCCQGDLQCPQNYLSYRLQGTNQVQTCQQGISTCPQGFQCMSAINQPGASLCCGEISTALCNNNQFLYINPQTNQRQFCEPNQPNCPFGFQCSASTMFGRFLCCGSGQSTARCANGGQPYTFPGQTIPQTCQPFQSTCTFGYSCQASDTPGLYYCCTDQGGGGSSAIDNALCSSGSPYIYPGTTRKLPCFPGGDPCPVLYSCAQSSNMAGTYLCCGGGAPSSGQCPQGTTGNFVFANQIQTCTPQNPQTCPPNFSCQPSTLVGQYLCCTGTGTGSGNTQPNCANGAIPYSTSLQPRQTCSSLQNTCQIGYSCQQSTTPNIFICCLNQSPNPNPVTNLQCPIGYIELRVGTTQGIQECSQNFASCPQGYACYRASNDASRFLCCGVATVSYCPSGQRPLLTDNNQPLECRPNVANNCAFGYSCVYSASQSRSYCCGSAKKSGPSIQFCPDGTTAYMIQGLSRPLTCAPTQNTCPPGYGCTRNIAVPLTTAFFCCTSAPNDGCPEGSEAYINPLLNAVQLCRNTDAIPCPTNFRCIYSIPYLRYQCCGQPTAAASIAKKTGADVEDLEIERRHERPSDLHACPDGTFPYINPTKKTTLMCPPDNLDLGCPLGYACRWIASERIFQCCSLASAWKNRMHRDEGLPLQNDGLLNYSTQATTPAVETITTNNVNNSASGNCGIGYLLIRGTCQQLFYPGESGCQFQEQCSALVSGASCSQNFCVCQTNRLVFGRQCVDSCPNNYINIAGRCNPVGQIFLSADAIADANLHKNGTLDGWCLNTVIPANQCTVPNSICHKQRLICVCREGFEKKQDSCTLSVPFRAHNTKTS